MRRRASFFLLIAITAGLLAACGGSTPAAAPTAAPAAAPTAAEAPTAAPAAEAPTAAPAAEAPTAAPAAEAPTAAAAAGGGSGEKIVIVSSLPRTGSSKGQTDTIVNAIKQRLEE